MPIRINVRLWFIFPILAVAAGVAGFLYLRQTEAAYGPALAFCPGPDQYGYICAAGASFSYVEGVEDTQLYADDAAVELALPFPFTFYGHTYERLFASSNGTIQFDAAAPAYNNRCLSEGIIAGLGEMIAAYWDDLDLTMHGYLRTAVVGQPPDRIFVVEWDDVPRFGFDSNDRVTFAVQLFESRNDILVLYRDVTTDMWSRGRSATIGLQSEQQGRALEFSCNQPAVADTSGLLFVHPERPNQTAAMAGDRGGGLIAAVPVKGDVALLAERLEINGRSALAALNRQWQMSTPSRRISWETADLAGDGDETLIVLWSGPAGRPELSRLALFDGATVVWEGSLSRRNAPFAQPELAATADLTGDGRLDILLSDLASGRMLVLADRQLYPVPGVCNGRHRLGDVSGDGVLDIVRDGCVGPGHKAAGWDGQQFVPLSP